MIKKNLNIIGRLKNRILIAAVFFHILPSQAVECEGFAKDYDAIVCEALFLNYQDNGFDRFFHRGKKLLFDREDLSRAQGEQDLFISQEVFDSIKATKLPRIDFNESKLDPFDHRGTCSAMALDFLARYEITAATTENKKELVSALKNFKPYYRANTTTFSSRQAAFNTIEIKSEYRDTQREINNEQKMKSLALYHNIKLLAATESLSMKKIKNGSINFPSIVNRLSSGSYIIRLQKPADNEKMEQFGHTVCLIKNPSFCFFYDCITGVEEISGNIGQEVLDSLLLTVGYIPELRIYKALVGPGGARNISSEISNDWSFLKNSFDEWGW